MHRLLLVPWFLVLVLSLRHCCKAAPEEEDHPDPNDEDYDGMIYIGRFHHHNAKRVGFEEDNAIRYIFGTSFDESHKEIEEYDLLHYDSQSHADLADRNHPTKTREQVLRERRHKPLSEQGPKPFGHVGMNYCYY